MKTRIVIDQMGRNVEVCENPKRIISLVPSQTELLHYLGLEDEVIGITKFCIHPTNWFQNKKRIGGTKDLKITDIISLKPDLIIGNKEENNQSDIEELERLFPVWMSDINNFEDALAMIEEVGFLTHTITKAKLLISKINDNFKSCSKIGGNNSVIYFIWDKPVMVAGKNTFIDSILNKLGLVNLIQANRYPNLENTILKGQPDYLFLSSEPYPFSGKHVQKFQELYPKTKILLVDGEMFSWYGSRLIFTPEYVKNLLK